MMPTSSTLRNTGVHEHIHLEKHVENRQNEQQQYGHRQQSFDFKMAQEHADRHDAGLDCGGDCWCKTCTPTCSNNKLKYTFTVCIGVHLQTKGLFCALKLPSLGFFF